MIIKKFEARTMKEALEMVKTQLGPDAIILSAKDNQKKFGLVGESSFEITAAVSEETLQQKKFVDSRLRMEDREKLAKSSARMQKQVIHQMVQKYSTEVEDKKVRPLTRTRYIEIDDESVATSPADLASERIKHAAERAWSAFADDSSSRKAAGKASEVIASVKPNAKVNPFGIFKKPEKPQTQNAYATRVMAEDPVNSPQLPQARHQIEDPSQVRELKIEIEQLRQVISQFQKIPQAISQSTFPGSGYGLPFEASATFEKLVNAGIAEEFAARLLEEAALQMPPAKLKNKALVDAFVAKKILDETLVSQKTKAQVHVFVGPAGSGKTSTLVKMASHFVVKEHKKVAIITTDSVKVGAQDQMRIYAHILNVPFAVVKSKLDWPRIMAQVSDYDHVLVDCPGVGLKSMEEISLVRQLLPPDALSPQIHLVLSALAKDSDLSEIGRRYQVTGYHDVIFTSLDESAQHGTIYNFMKRYQIPLHSFGVGTRVPEDFEMASKERLLDLIFKITKMNRPSQNEGANV